MTKVLLKLDQNPLTIGVTRDHVSNIIHKMEQEASPIPLDEDSNVSTVTEEESPTTVMTVKRGWQPKGSTIAVKCEIKKAYEDASVWATKRLVVLQDEAKKCWRVIFHVETCS
jgi:hypothetical protein